MTRTAVITGASRNIGLAIARDLLDSGDYRVVAIARDEERLRKAYADVAAAGGRLKLVSADLASESSTEQAIQAILDDVGDVDVLVNNAVQRVTYALPDHPLSEFRQAINVSLVSAFQLMKAFVPGMAENGFGRVVNVAGLIAQRGSPSRSAVVAAKAGLIGLTKALALEYAAAGVTLNVLSPGPIETERGEWTTTGDRARLEQLYAQRRKEIPVGRRGSIEEVVSVCRFLLSDGAAYMTGQTVSPNGGLLML